ncbi:DNA-binding protein [Janthinobacterium agaricidamnosum]|uniref:Mucin-associated surface protein n=1 Tax=Janthinobacterium agaricidamnosum NBRC 102515 = DSM 9628 TaxID=1349767 RepID=W0V1B6_9BURK|nr:DNA-binding protein [Janthinobacterium agaricidamnosum]CDG82614.1 mucin-associated surface protein [Janthinobacterium agaricidamnosum NBRC 102515 = DSM 9628]
MMGREARVSPEQVNSAADAMVAEGVKPSARAVRERLGNIGCLGTISKLLQRRKAGQQRQVAAVADLSPVLQRAILDFVGQEISANNTEHEAESSEQQQELSDLATENERQQDTIDNQVAELDGTREELERERLVAGQARTDLAKAQLKLESLPRLEEAAEKARMDLAKAQFKLEDIPRLEEAAQQARAELIQAQLKLESMTRLEGELAALRGELEAEREELAEVRAELDEERTLRIKAQQFIVDPIFKTPL